MSVSQGIKGYLSTFGVRGLVAISSYRLCGFPKTLNGYSSKLKAPVRLRVRTTDIAVFSEIIVQEEYRFGLPRHADVIVDAGANIGMASIYYATKFPNARVFSIEAEKSNYDVMVENVRPYPNITSIHAALWSRDGSIRVNAPPSGAFGKWGFAVSDDPGDVRALTVPSLMSEFGIGHIDIFKIDIEGAEKEVFLSCDWQNHVDSFVIELHDRFKPGCSSAVNEALRGFSTDTKGELTCYRKPGKITA